MAHDKVTLGILTLLTTVNSNICRDFNDGDIEDEIREALRMFDKEGNGFITSVG